MDIEYTEEKKDQMIAQRGRRFYLCHMNARVLRRTLPGDNAIRREGEKAERKALDSLISTIETVDKPRGSQT